MKGLEKKVWEQCRRLTRERYGDVCYTCGQDNLVGVNCQTGHMIPKYVLPLHLKYDLRVLRIQCYRCNINLGGNGAVFLWKYIREEGAASAKALFTEMEMPGPEDEIYYLSELLDNYRLR